MFKNSYFEDLMNFLFPKVCVNCELISNTYLCEECKSCLKIIDPECFLTRQKSNNWEIKNKFKSKTSLEKVYYFYEYNSIIHNFIAQIKYQNRKDLISDMARLIIENNEFQRIDFSLINKITFIPMHTRKQRVRGFNQTELLANLIGKQLEIPVEKYLIKTVNTKPQADLTRDKRLQNLKNTFVLVPDLDIDKNSNILLIDDICSTGSTLEECARTMKKQFPYIKVFGLALARGKA